MARVNNKARLVTLAGKLSSSTAGILADFLETAVIAQNADNLDGIETSTRKRRAKPAAEEAAPTRRKRRAAAEEAPAKPARRSRRAAAEVEDEKPARRSRKPKAEALPEDVTLDDLYDILEGFSGEPVAGTLRELRPLVEARGIVMKDFPYSEDGLTAKEKAEEVGMFLAACDALEASIIATLKEDEDAMADIIEDLDLELRASARASTIAKAIIVSLNEDADEGDEDEGDEDDADDEDDAEEEVAPRRKRRAAKAEADEEDEKPARRGRRAAKAEVEDEDDLSDLDDLD